MGFLQTLFKGKHREEAVEIVERRLALDETKFNVMIIHQGRQAYAEEFIKTSSDLTFSRFFVTREEPPGPHYAPTLDQALEWFKGRKLPKKDGYGSISWGETFKYCCSLCNAPQNYPSASPQLNTWSSSGKSPIIAKSAVGG